LRRKTKEELELESKNEEKPVSKMVREIRAMEPPKRLDNFKPETVKNLTIDDLRRMKKEREQAGNSERQKEEIIEVDEDEE
jgi:hypothetical protein